MAEGHAAFLADRLALGAVTMGQVRVEPGFSVMHVEDAGRSDLEVFCDPHEALEIARYDEAGTYRPLKSAPNLARGWRLELASLRDVVLALDFLHPAALGTAVWHAAGELRPVSLRQTLERQSGMYAVTRQLRAEQAGGLVEGFCRRGCLRKILWSCGDEGTRPVAQTEQSAILPLLCAEACHLFIAEARKVVKAASP